MTKFIDTDTALRADEARYRQWPDVVVLPGNESSARPGRPPVRIFVGTEDGQWRAERIFFYSIEQVRDPARRYEIHLLKNLHGFDRRGWRTGFTNYRFAVPEFAGFEGKAIYNDVDQIYLADPSRLFDLDLNGHGYLSISAEDTSVMLLDCSRMAEWWTREKASHGKKPRLVREPSARPGIWGKLDDGWNARDLEYTPAVSKLLHFTALHLQPWQPFPEDYSYHPHPLGALWLELEQRADAQGYQVFGPERTSGQFPAALSRRPVMRPREASSPRALAFLRGLQVRSVLAAHLADGDAVAHCLSQAFDVQARRIDQVATEASRYDAVVVAGLLEQCPAEDVPWLLEAMFSRARRALWIALDCCDAPNREADVDVTRAVRPLRWWHQQIAHAAERHASVAWQLDARNRAGRATTLRATGLIDNDTPPSVWILEGLRAGDNAQLHRLSGALGWPTTPKRLDFNPFHVLPNFLLGASLVNLRRASRASLAPPWPDVVIALGKRSAGAARWIRKHSGGRTRLVHLGRPWARLDAFDLIVTTPQYRLPARDNVQHNRLPLTPVTTGLLEERRKRIERQYAGLHRPLIAVLVGGRSWSYAFRPGDACRLGEAASRRARETGGTLLATTSPRTGRRSADALLAAIDAPHRAHRYRAGQASNPYPDYLAIADEIVVTGDSASMIADAVTTGRPVTVFGLPRRPLARVSAALGGLLARRRGVTDRGTPRQQGAAARLYDSLIDRGLVTPSRDLEHLHRSLALQGLIDAEHGRPDQALVTQDEAKHTVNAVKRLFIRGRKV